MGRSCNVTMAVKELVSEDADGVVLTECGVVLGLWRGDCEILDPLTWNLLMDWVSE
jgi:hypothetical protein